MPENCDFIVLGSGPGGYVAAIRVAREEIQGLKQS
jgi:pyruvate/2-oxoglutarate dehydrogenase complex dihydrolipoamide dehydrogenase (E3) component